MNKQSSCSSQIPCKQNEYLFSIDEQRTILISSQFQNGNISLVKQVNELHYILEALSDVNTANSKKSWFHFKVRADRGIKVRLVIQNVNIYENIFEDRAYCKPMMREGEKEWQQVCESFLTFRDDVNLVMEHTFRSSQQVYFCLSIPFTYTQNQQYLKNLNKYINSKIYYQDQILAITPNKYNVHLLTITEYGYNSNKKSKEREAKKPIIFITARVHPGEVSSSFCLQGILEFLLSYNNLQAYLLRRMFIFKIVPMLNPDGVVQGNYRADPQGYNLNRFYLEPQKEQHPAIFQLVQLIKRLGANQKIEYYFDLHSHSSIKQSFIYGNAFEDIVSQAYSQYFCKILEQNFPRFRYYLSNFGQMHMKHKDKGQPLSKQGCGRVVISRLCAVACSYTVQSSIFPSSYNKFIHKVHKSQPQNTDFITESKQYQETYYFEPLFVTNNLHENIIIAENKKLGKSLMISILDMISKNPYSRLRQNYAEDICKDLSNKLLQNQDRFKLMDLKAYQKARNIIEFIHNKFQHPLQKEWNAAGVVDEINNHEWPPIFKRIEIMADVKPSAAQKSDLKKLRMKTEGKNTQLRVSLKKVKKQSEKQIQAYGNKLTQTHRTISPNNHNQTKSLFPEIKYSIQMKINKKEVKSNSIKEMNINFIEQSKQTSKNCIVDYFDNQAAKLNTQKQLFKKSTNSLNKLIANKIQEKEKNQIKGSRLRAYNMLAENRSRIKTDEKEGNDNEKRQVPMEGFQREPSNLNINQSGLRGLQLKKTQIIKKRLMLTNKAVQILKKSDRGRIKLPEVNKISLIVENYKKAEVVLTQENEQNKNSNGQIDT